MPLPPESLSPSHVPRVAVIGSGIAGLAAAWRLGRRGAAGVRVTLFESGQHFGGHAHTVDLSLDGVSGPVDTGFLVFNHRTYPQLTRLFQDLGVATVPSDMSFSVQVPRPDGRPGLEWSGHSLATVFAQRRNLLRPGHWRMLAEILRFNRLATRMATQLATGMGGAMAGLAQAQPQASDPAALQASVGEFLDRHRFGAEFRQHYLLPMLGCIWSCPTDQMLRFPVATMLRFCHNHGLLQVNDRPQWHTVQGGSRQYVRRLVAQLDDARLATPVLGVRRQPGQVLVRTAHASEVFDAVVLACHPDQALGLLGGDATPDERRLLGAIRYQPNTAVLHTDAAALPRRRAAWAAWNYERAAEAGQEQARVCLHYWINRLQPLPWQTPVVVSLNPVRPIDERRVHARIEHAHPVFDAAALAAQQQSGALQGVRRTWYAGAWLGYGFHEDGLRTGLQAAEAVQQRLAGAALGQAA